MAEQAQPTSSPSFDMARIGNDWIAKPIVHQGIASELHVRKLPPGYGTGAFPFVALSFLEKECERAMAEDITRAIQARLETGARALLAAVHYLPNGRVYWYSYAGDKKTLEELFGILGQRLPLLLGINEDAGWNEYRFMHDLVSA